MKTGILTFHRATNYGAFLQAYAMKSFLNENGYAAEMVDYWPDAHANYVDRRKLTATGWLNIAKQTVLYLLATPLFIKRKQKMRRLRSQYLGISKRPSYRFGTQLEQTDYDVVIYGSDQIWWNHTSYSKEIAYDKAYWGYYMPDKTRRIAYAPSMGIIDIHEQDKAFIREALHHFSSLSTRETSLREALLPYTDKEITTVLDPVFLPDRLFWEKQVKPRQIQEPYLLYYSLIPSPESYSHAKLLAQAKGLKFIEIAPRVRRICSSKDLIQTADALEFMSYIYHADYVVSTSFHGTAFAIILEKEFCVVGLGKQSGRVVSLLTQLGIEERYTNNPSALGSIDYTPVRERLSELQRTSREYLTDAIRKK